MKVPAAQTENVERPQSPLKRALKSAQANMKAARKAQLDIINGP